MISLACFLLYVLMAKISNLLQIDNVCEYTYIYAESQFYFSLQVVAHLAALDFVIIAGLITEHSGRSITVSVFRVFLPLHNQTIC